MIHVDYKGDETVDRSLERMRKINFHNILIRNAHKGLNALKANTPVDSGITAGSWGYEITKEGDDYRITWTNSSSNKGVNIVIILQYGHGTGTGGYVAGRDFINPATKPIFDEIEREVWRAVISA